MILIVAIWNTYILSEYVISRRKSATFAEEKEIVAKLKKSFLMVAGSADQKYGPDLEAHQQL